MLCYNIQKELLMSGLWSSLSGVVGSAYEATKSAAETAYNSTKNAANNLKLEAEKKLYPPPMTPQFVENGKLSPDEFIAAGDKLTEVCNGWKWKPSSNPHYSSKYLNEKKQYLILEDVHCYHRIKDLETSGKAEEVLAEDGQQITVLHASEVKQAENQKEDHRFYKMFIIYDEAYHTPRMFFSATDFEGKPISYQNIKQDIQKEYIGATLTDEYFPFVENCRMPTVHPCKHANVLKTMSDAMRENGQKVEAHYALLIFLKFITSVIPTVQFDLTGDLQFS